MYKEFYAKLQALLDTRLVSLHATPILEVSLLRLANIAVDKERPIITQFGKLDEIRIYFAFTKLAPVEHQMLHDYLLAVDSNTAHVLHEETHCYAIAVDKLSPKLFHFFDRVDEVEWDNYREATLTAARETNHSIPEANRRAFLRELKEIAAYCKNNITEHNPDYSFISHPLEAIASPHITLAEVALWLGVIENKLNELKLTEHLIVKNYLDTLRHFLRQTPVDIAADSKNFLIPLSKEVGRIEERTRPKPGFLSGLWGRGAVTTDAALEKTSLTP